MNWKPTLRDKSFLVCCLSVLSFMIQTVATGQVSYVNASTLVSSDHATSPLNATIYDNSYTTLNSYGGVAVGLGSYSGKVELEFPSTLPAGKTTFIRIDFDQDVLNALLGGNLGGGLADLLGTVVLGNHYFTVAAKNNASTVAIYSSQNNFSTEAGKLIKDVNGNFYFAITPNQPYNRVEITDTTSALLLGTFNSMRVYHAYYTDGTNVCISPFATSFDGTGGTVDLLGLGAAGVSNSENAIDTNANSYSHISLGVLSLAGTMSQTVYFDALSNPTDQVHVTVQLDNPSILSLGLSDGFKIEALNGTNVVHTLDVGTVLDLDLLGLLSGGQKATIPISPGQPFDRVKLTLSSLVQLNLTKGVRFYDVYKSPAAPTIALSSQNATICEGQSVTLLADTANDNELVWFDSSTSNTPIAVTAFNVGYTTPVLNTTTTYYVASRKIGCPQLSSRIPVVVTVLDLPTAADITISSPITASCSGEAILNPTTLIANSSFNYYTDQLMSQEIDTGFSGHSGLTYVKNTTNGELTITGLNSGNTPMTYFIAVEVAGLCENAANTLLPVEVVFPTQTLLTVSPTLSGCGSVNLADAIVGFDTTGATTYSFFDGASNPITAEDAQNISVNGTYYVQASNASNVCASVMQEVVVTVNPLPVLQVNPTTYNVNIGDSVTLTYTSDATVIWYDSDGNALASNIAGPFTTSGSFTFTAVASNSLCNTTITVTIVVNDPANCGIATRRVYAETQTEGSIITGGVSNNNQAIDNNPQTYSTITTGLGLLGVGTTWQTLQWNSTIPAGTPLTVKLGTEYSGLALIGAISVVGTKRNGMGVPEDIGVIQPLSGTLLDLLPGENCFEYTFVPSNITGPKPYDGVRIIVGSVLSVAQNAKVYEAYYYVEENPAVCSPGDIEDVFHGVYDLGIGVLTSTTSVQNPWNAVDNDDDSFATMYNGVGVLSASDLTVKFKTASQPTDILKIKLTKSGSVLSVGALAGFTVQAYMGNVPVGNPLIADGSTANIELLNGGSEIIFVSNTQLPSYDRVRIRLGGVANVLDFVQVHYVKREALIDITDTPDTTITVCQGGSVSIVPDACTTYRWYDAATGGNVLADGISYTIPANITGGTYDFFVQPIRGGCEVLSRTKVTVTVMPAAPEPYLMDVLVNATTDTTICSDTGNVTLTAQLSSVAAVVTNPVYYWYSFDGTNQVLIPGQNGNVLQLTGLTPGTYTYYVGVSSDEYCETLQPDRKSVTFTILPFSTDADIQIANQNVCIGNPVILEPNSSLTNPQFSWYFTNDTTQPVSNGTFGGITYLIDANGVLTVTGLTTLNSPYTYYISMASDTTCSNMPGTLKAVTVQVNDTVTPTTTEAIQSFCESENPTVAMLQTNEAGTIWYDAPANGNIISSSTALVDGMIYYGSLTDNVTGCSSSTRLEVTAQINVVATPTTTDAIQDFCSADSPTVASLQVNETGVIWYDAPSGGNVIAPTTALVDDGIYYAGITDVVTGCSSTSLLAVTVNLNSTATPTTNDTTQDFCGSDNPTIAMLQVNEAGVIWYDAPMGGNVLISTTPLTDGGIYYAGITDAVTGCSSVSLLAVTVSLNSVSTPTTTDTTQEFCASDSPTIGMLQVNETGVIWYDAPTGGNVLSSTTLLVDGQIYYAGITDSVTGCSSEILLAVSANLDEGQTPTTTGTIQDFCEADNPTIASLQVNEAGVIWYDAPTGGNVLASTTLLEDGTTYYAGMTDSITGCLSTTLLGITVNFNASGPATINGGLNTTCILSSVTYTTESGMSNYIWTVSDDGLITAGGGVNDDFVTITWQQPGVNSVGVSYNNSLVCNLPSSETLNIVVEICVGGVGEDPCLTVYNEFTPNEDGSNDTFNIKCAEFYPNNKLAIYNRYGNLVFETRGYANDWRGISNVSNTFDGNVLATGTYYYTFESGDAENIIKSGWLFIMR
ncbi:gliding motility-associated C-terminal domain-containing protein [Flavobacterium sp.]|uniref:gliding motility-associated C-terminal domain-containing protein n=1 Tax=Flavobacterium sp. TaxID=239 RepID=UPI0028BE0D39|nr:gliding motility-associated C-terminal domain-containing protein [Flavobacterium sp.]